MPARPLTERTAGILPAGRLEAGGPVEWRSRGYLPHADSPDLVQHIVFRLADSLPAAICEDVAKRNATERARAIDAALDIGHGRRHLASAPIAKLVQNALLAFDTQRYRLLAWCVMPNHVHVLMQPNSGWMLEAVVHSWKSYTANKANRILQRRGPFWAREYFDRAMRDDRQLAATAGYIEANPVRAGLCANVSDWPFSSASTRTAGILPAGRLEAGGPEDGHRQ